MIRLANLACQFEANSVKVRKARCYLVEKSVLTRQRKEALLRSAAHPPRMESDMLRFAKLACHDEANSVRVLTSLRLFGGKECVDKTETSCSVIQAELASKAWHRFQKRKETFKNQLYEDCHWQVQKACVSFCGKRGYMMVALYPPAFFKDRGRHYKSCLSFML